MTSLLSGYWAATHDQKPYLDYYRKLQPADILILQPDVQQISDACQASPESTFTLRRWDWDDNRGEGNPGIYPHLQHDPEGYARWLVDQYAAWVPELERQARERGIPFPDRAQLLGHHVNEPDTNYLLPQINRTTVVAAKLFRERLGMGCDMLNIGTGQPALLNAHGEPDWSPLAEALDACVRYDCPAVGHEYFNDMPMDDASIFPWHIGRHAKWAPRGPKWKIGEFGLEMLVNNRRDNHHGWLGIVSEEEMIRRTAVYLDGLRDDVIAARWYMDDYADRVWRTFDSQPLHDRLLVLGWRFPSIGRAATAKPEHKAHIPVVTVGTPPQAPTAEPEQPQPVELRGSAVDPLVLGAIVAIESGGQAFGPDGKPIIRFEAHIFMQRRPESGRFRFNAQRPWTEQQMYVDGEWFDIHIGSQASEYAALALATTIDRQAAYASISMGLGQIMGFNAQRVGYPEATAMFRAFSRSQAAQLAGMFNFILSDDALMTAVRNRDWRTIAALYNGPGNVDAVAPRLQAAYARLLEASK